ncbi:hypothetical protein ACFOY2_05265 [Nonomuraea purpurea]|uniref:Uncharacterized protein n=1 Tax=Nonomuraea purpurea TaxID=1849276 RepID=A0ABV8G0J0_9ACTN
MSAPVGSAYVLGGVNVRAVPSPSAAANLISMPDADDGVTLGVVTLLPEPALLEAYTPGSEAPCTQIRIAAPLAPPVCVSEYVDGSAPVAVFTKARPRVYVCPDVWEAICVHPDGAVMIDTSPLSMNWPSTRTSPATTPEGRPIVYELALLSAVAVVWER